MFAAFAAGPGFEAARSFGLCPLGVMQAGNSGNNRLYRVDCGGKGVFALKFYPQTPNDTRNRRDTEFKALRFLQKAGVKNVPKALELGENSALYEWVEGEAVKESGLEEINQALEFIRVLKEVSEANPDFPLASEACLSLGEINRQVRRRLARLKEVASRHRELAAFLADLQIPPECADKDIPLPAQILSPSDFGFHNAIRRPDGSLVFIDFEYFGWDDPVKLVADFLWHPGMKLSQEQKAHFREGALKIFAFQERLDLAYPLYGLRWVMILLNEFLPERWERRRAAGNQEDHQVVLNRQLSKAREYLERLQHG